MEEVPMAHYGRGGKKTVGEDCIETVPSQHEKTTALTQQLWLPAQVQFSQYFSIDGGGD